MNGRVASRFSEERDYSSLKKWMNKLVTVHGGIVEVEDEEPDDEIQFHSDIGDEEDEDDLESEEDIEAEMVGLDDKLIKKM